MKAALIRTLCGAVTFALTAVFALANAQQTKLPNFSTEKLARRTLERRAVDAAIGECPLSAETQCGRRTSATEKQSTATSSGGLKGNAWKNQSLTPNTSLRYLYVFFNTKDHGPIVLDLPPAANGAALLGTIADAWQVPLTDVGVDGRRVASSWCLPPGYTRRGPGWLHRRGSPRPTTPSPPSVPSWQATRQRSEQNGDVLVNQIKIYPLAKADNPPAQRFVDMTNTMYNGLVQYDESIYVSLARMLNEEPVRTGRPPDDGYAASTRY